MFQAVRELIARHPSLRANFVLDRGQAVQVLQDVDGRPLSDDERPDLVGARQAEVKADHRRAEGFDHVGHLGAEGAPAGAVRALLADIESGAEGSPDTQ